jgi:transposase
MKFHHYLGIDVSKKVLDVVCRTNGLHLRITNNAKGFQLLSDWLQENNLAADKTMFIFEHTGLYSKPFEQYCIQQGWQYCAVPGLAVKRSVGIARGKSDRVDATRIAQYGFEKKEQLKPTIPAQPNLERLKTLVNYRDRLVSQKAGFAAAIKEQLRFLQLDPQDLLISSQKAMIDALQQQIDQIQQAIMQIIRADQALSRNYDLLTSITAIGFVNAVYALVYTDNFTRFTDGRKFASYCGTAPFEDTSGSSRKGKTRVSHLANKKLKSVLDQAAKCAINYDKELNAFYNRRILMGKSKMSTINIVRNKLIYRMFAVIKRQNPFEKNYSVAA